MDNQPNIVETQTTTPPVPTPSEPKPKGNASLIVLCVILGLIIVCLLTYIAYQKGLVEIPFLDKANTNTNTQAEENADDTTVAETETATETFTGEAVSATLPEGWTIEEYFNGDGSDMLTEGITYTGLTGLKIFNTDDEEMLWLKGVYGIGFEGCSEYYAFEDDNPTYRQEMQDMVDEIGDTMHVNDFSSMPYTEYEWLGHSTRRVANRFYQDSEEGNSYFEASCFNILVVLDGVSFEDNDGYAHSGYFYEFPETITGDQLVQIDGILESMSAVE